MTEAEVAGIYRKMGPLVERRCRRMLGSDAAAKDATQEVFLRLWRFGDRFAAAESKLGWLYRVAQRCCFDQLSRRATRATAREAGCDREGFVDPAGRIEEREIVLAFLGEFDDKLRRIAVLHYLDQMGQEEIAAAVGCSRQTVVNRLAVLRERAAAFRIRHLEQLEDT